MVKKKSTRSGFDGKPEYETDEGALDLWKYFTQTKKYFNPDEITAVDKEGIKQQIKDFMNDVPKGINKGDLSKFSNPFSKKITSISSITESIQKNRFNISVAKSKITGKKIGKLFTVKTGFKDVVKTPSFVLGKSKRNQVFFKNPGSGRFVSKKLTFK